MEEVFVLFFVNVQSKPARDANVNFSDGSCVRLLCTIYAPFNLVV